MTTLPETNPEILELPTEEVPTGREFYIGVNFYEGETPYASVYEQKPHHRHFDKIYKIIIPLRILSSNPTEK